MKSPYFWQNLAVLLLMLANLAFSVFVIVRKPGIEPPEPRDSSAEKLGDAAVADGAVIRPRASLSRIILRAFCVGYATISCMLFLLVLSLVVELEMAPISQQAWQRRHDWKQIRTGLTKKEVTDILGEPDYQDTWNDEERYQYKLHPMDLAHSADVCFNLPSPTETAVQKVVSKFPEDEHLEKNQSDWWPDSQSFRYSSYKNSIALCISALSFIGIVLITLVTLLPIWALKDCYALSLYFPIAAILLAGSYEYVQKDGWRFDVVFLLPMYLAIVGVWIFRVALLVNVGR